MKKKQSGHVEKKPAAVFLFYLLDAAAFIALMFYGVRNNLLWSEGLYGAARAILTNVVLIAALVGMHKLHVAFAVAGKVRGRGLVKDLALFFIVTVPPPLLTFVTPVKGKPDFVWLPLEWLKLPENVVLLANVTPWLFACELIVFAALVWLMCARRKRFFPIIISGALFALGFRQLFVLSKESNLIFYFFQYSLIPLLAFVCAVLNKPRMFARAGLAATMTALLLWQYIGFAPFNPRPDVMPDPAISMLYPQQGAPPAFPLVFFRDFYVDANRNMLYTAFGPTSGIVRLDLSTDVVKIIPTPTGLVRYLWTQDALNTVYAIDWIRCDLLAIDKDTFEIKQRTNIYRTDASIPLALEVVGDRLYVTTTEKPGLTEYDLATMKITRRLDLQPFTKFRSGVWRMAYDPTRDKLYIEMGYTDLKEENKLLRVDRRSLTVDANGVGIIPAGGMELLAIPEKRRIISASFFTHSLWEFDMDSMKLLRRIEGPINCRNMAYDSRRNVIYATSFLGGELRVIRYNDGATLKKLRLGNKASSLFLSPEPEHKTLYLGNGWGVMKVDLNSFLSGI